MNRKVVPSIIFVLLVFAGPAAADLFITPYGSFTNFIPFPTKWTLEIDTPQYTESIGVSELDNAFGGGIAIGISSEEGGYVFGLNVESFYGKTDSTFTSGTRTVGDRTIDGSAIAVGGFVGGMISGLSKGNWQGVLGIELGAIIPQGDISLMYKEDTVDENGNYLLVHRTEKQDLEGTSFYMSLFFTEDYLFANFIGLSGTLGYRGVNTKLQTIETESMSGKYVQEYSGFFARLGVKLEF